MNYGIGSWYNPFSKYLEKNILKVTKTFLSTTEWLVSLTGYFQMAYFNSFPHASAQSEAGSLHVPNSRVAEEGQLITYPSPLRLLQQKEKPVAHCLISSKYTDKIMGVELTLVQILDSI